MSHIIACQNISKSYPGSTRGDHVSVLKAVSLTVKKGQIAGVIGRSGAGKSTLIRVLGGLTAPDEGTVTVFEESLWPGPKRDLLRRMGTVSQGYNLLSRRTVSENILLPQTILGIKGRSALELAALVGIEDLLGRYPAQLSGGQRQRVAIARALSTGAHLLLCDEITSALDRETTYEILSLLQDLNQRLGVTVVLITHDMGVVREICDSVYVLDAGSVVDAGDVESILMNPQHATTQSLLGHLSRQELPQHLASQLRPDVFENAQAVLEILFAGDAANQPIIADLVGKLGIPVNIIAGHLDHVRRTAFGNLIISVPLSDGALQRTLDYCAGCHVGTHILGYSA
jgi:D-methionine transport system ATP-binding protein